MKITTRGHYGVQVMVGLAQFWGQGPVPLSLLAKNQKIPHDYLEQLMIPLRRQGLVWAQRGAHGGYLLSRDPGKITMREVLQTLEGEIAPVVCISQKVKTICLSAKSCSSKKIWKKIHQNFLKSLDSVNLKEAI